jgi:hypothetical protein
MANNEFGKMLLAEIRRYHAKVQRARETGYVELLDEAPPPATMKHRFRVINGGRADCVRAE